ncbi:MAG: alpha/beta fold hydrolase [Burkholderiales bacterium]|nr:alpha/beta fold hydrolase [Burkholderiales bacterium]
MAFVLPTAVLARSTTPTIGFVVLHGKGGRPGGLTAPLAASLQQQGMPVVSPEMPWSGKRQYDADVAAAETQVTEAVRSLRQRGAAKVFLAGHSQGAVFALHYATKHPLDGLILIAPGGNVATNFYRQKVGASVSQARRLVADGKGGEPGEFDEFEGDKGLWKVRTTAAIYLSWFDPDGAMNQMKSSRALPKTLPVLHVAPASDYPALLRAKQDMFDALATPLKRLHEPQSNHRNAPRDAAGEIARWIAEIASDR